MPKTRIIPKLGRKPHARRALYRNQVTSLFKHERIRTTLAKAKALMRISDYMITLAKRGTLADYKRAAAFIREPLIVRKTFTELAERYKFRPGGYTRVLRTFNRRIDYSPMAYIELVDRVGEFRPAREVNYLTALKQKLVPEPLSPIRTANDLRIASAISPSTSNRVALNRPHFARIKPDHTKYYPEFTRKTVHKQLYIRRWEQVKQRRGQVDSVRANKYAEDPAKYAANLAQAAGATA